MSLYLPRVPAPSVSCGRNVNHFLLPRKRLLLLNGSVISVSTIGAEGGQYLHVFINFHPPSSQMRSGIRSSAQAAPIYFAANEQHVLLGLLRVFVEEHQILSARINNITCRNHHSSRTTSMSDPFSHLHSTNNYSENNKSMLLQQQTPTYRSSSTKTWLVPKGRCIGQST